MLVYFWKLMIAMFRPRFFSCLRFVLINGVVAFWVSASILGYAQTSDVPSAYLENSYSLKTDQELSNLLARWGSLSALERRFLLAETRGRLVGKRKVRQVDSGKAGVQVQRRYGSVVSRQNGSTLVVKTQVTRVIKNRDNRDNRAVRNKPSKPISYNRITVKPNRGSDQSSTSESRSGVVRVTYGTGFEKRAIKESFHRESSRIDADEVSSKQKERN